MVKKAFEYVRSHGIFPEVSHQNRFGRTGPKYRFRCTDMVFMRMGDQKIFQRFHSLCLQVFQNTPGIFLPVAPCVDHHEAAVRGLRQHAVALSHVQIMQRQAIRSPSGNDDQPQRQQKSRYHSCQRRHFSFHSRFSSRNKSCRKSKALRLHTFQSCPPSYTFRTHPIP